LPQLAIEVVSPGHPYKDYVDAPDRCAACGIPELWIYDPLLAGKKKHGGPWLLQVWRTNEAGRFVRVFAGSGPAYSRAVDAWLHPVAGRLPGEAKLRIGSRDGRDLWLTQAEQDGVEKHEGKLRAEQLQTEKDEEKARADEATALAQRLQTEKDEEKARADEEKARADAATALAMRLQAELDRFRRE
jgi:hypothetical protein